MHKAEKERMIEELTERLRSAETLIVADYRGLTNGQLADLRIELLKHGARLTVVKNTLTRRAAEGAGADALLALLEGPTAIAFVETEGNPAAVAKALSDSARETKILTLRGGILSGKSITGAEIESLAKLPPLDVLQAQLVGVIVAPLTQLAAVLNAPLQSLVGLIDARITQLEAGGDTSRAAATAPAEAAPAEDPPAAESAEPAPSAEEWVGEAEAAEPAAEAEVPAEEPVPEPEVEAAAEEPMAETEAVEPAAEASENTEPEKNEEE
jgi:large subunit ribosomal protein L10